MGPELSYFIKINLALVLLYGFYRLFFYKDTHFKLRRLILLLFFAVAFAYPLFDIQEWVRSQQPIAEVIYSYSAMLPEVVVGEADSTSWVQVVAQAAFWGYLVGVGALVVRFLIRLVGIFRIARQCKRVCISSVPVYQLPAYASPFSFFRMIFIFPSAHSVKELEEILLHERAHVSQWHSIDVILAEFVTIFCWVNPFVWLLKREIRHNLEYLADNTVIHAGCDSRVYQFHLLGLTLSHSHSQSPDSLYNSFTILDIKNRIIMMNKKRSGNIGRTKYLVFLPLVALLMMFSNMEAVARITKELAAEIKATAGSVEEAVMDADGNPGVDPSVVAKDSIQPDRVVFTVVEEMPKYPGGDQALLEFLAKSIKYPVAAQDRGIQGRVTVSFIVENDGSISTPEIKRGIDAELDAEALRVIGLFPKWEPGKHRGNPVPVRYVVPVTFRLSVPKKGSDSGNANRKETETGDTVFKMVEEMPMFPGGDRALLEFLAKSIKYPEKAKKDSVQGRVIAAFTVLKTGRIADIEIINSLSPELNEESIRVINTMPEWTPGKQRGEVVNVRYTVPITFRLQ